MPAPRKKAIALLTTAAGLGILLVAGVVLYRPLEERYWLWKLTEGDEGEKERASDRLAELGVEEAVPILVGLIPRQLPGSHTARSWMDFTRAIRQDRYWKRALVKQHEFAVPYLRDLLKEESLVARFYAADILGVIGPPAIDAVPDLVQAGRTAREHPDVATSPALNILMINTLLALERISPGAARKYSSEILLDSETTQG